MELWLLANEIIYATDYVTVGNDVQYKTFEEDNVTYLIFQGSRSATDVILDSRFMPAKFDDINVHRGFAKGFSSAEKEILNCFDKGKPLVIAGHSMGGAYAILACYTIHKKLGIKAEKLILFGTPRIFVNKSSLRKVEDSFVSVESYEHIMDVVPKIPPFYKTFDSIKLGKFNAKEFFPMSKNHRCYPNKELYI